MMTPGDIRMCVADAMQDDEIEEVDSIVRMLNSESQSSWRAARGSAFSIAEVTTAIRELLAAGMITPCAEMPSSGDCIPISNDQVGNDYPIESLWFHLEQSGRDAVREWWETQGHLKYPLEPLE